MDYPIRPITPFPATSQAAEPVAKGKMTVVPYYPEPQAVIPKTFGDIKVSWCFGEDPNGWPDNNYIHWIEHDGVRGNPTGYRNPASIKVGDRTFMGFSAYYDGDLPIEQPIEITTGK